MNIVPLLESLANEILAAEELFLKNPKDFHSLEISVKSSTESFAASFLGEVLSTLNSCIFESGWRKERYTSHRLDKRTLISSVGDITFDSTYYRSIAGNQEFTHLVEDVIGIDRNERFTEDAEVSILQEAMKSSYEEATKVLPSRQRITKTTVMNKVHRIAEEMPDVINEEPKKVPYLFVEADEDHVAEQHGRASRKEDNKGFISKLIYVYEYKQDSAIAKGRKELVNTHYFSGLYPGSDGNRRLWGKVQRFIELNYDLDAVKRIFISGDGANWIKSGTDYLNNSVFCADKYHLMQYLNAAAGQMLDEKDSVKEELWHLLYSKSKRAKTKFDSYTSQMMKSAKKPEVIEKLRTYVLCNWDAVRRTLTNKLVSGCSAESHVSHVLSDRLSSRPMGWSPTGADRISKLRCFERNNGREKIIELVKYSRKQKRLAATGTEDVAPRICKVGEVVAEHYNQARSYIDRFQAHLVEGTAKKTAAIRSLIWGL